MESDETIVRKHKKMQKNWKYFIYTKYSPFGFWFDTLFCVLQKPLHGFPKHRFQNSL